jgi:hypothetical protein
MVTDLVPLRQLLAEQIRAEASYHHVNLVLTAKHYGTMEALDEINSPSDVKLGLVPGGITARTYPRVRTVTSLTNEPLHVIVRPEIAEKGFNALRGRRVDLGPPTTCSHHLALDVLEFVGLTPSPPPGSAGFTLETLSQEDLFIELRRIESLAGQERAQAIAKLPDACMFIAPMPSLLARRLVADAGYQLLPLSFAEAFCLDRLHGAGAAGVYVDRSSLSPAVIPPYTYGTNPPVPARACATIATPLMLVAEDDADPDAIQRLLETLYDSRLANAIRPPPLRDQSSTFPLHLGAERYLRRNEPLLPPEATANLVKIIGGLGAFASGIIALYTFLRLRKLNRFEEYFHEIGRIELIARGVVQDTDAPTSRHALWAHLEKRLSDLKCQVLEDFAAGGLKGEGLVTGIIAAINDTHSTIATALLRHEESRAGTPADRDPG